MRIALMTLLAAGFAFAAFTWWALESSGVAVIETVAPDGSRRSTHVWFAEPDGELWLEAGTPDNAWYRDVRSSPRVTFSTRDRSGTYLAEPLTGPSVAAASHERIRALLRAKYGLRDAWVALLFDTSRSVAVRLVPVETGQGERATPGR